MWYKVNELWSNGLNKSQIAREIGMLRKTVRRYLQFSEEGFLKSLEENRQLPLKLQVYYNFVYKQLESKPYLSVAQIEDRLKEHFNDLPIVHSKTVYNFVQSIRKKYNIAKPTQKRERQYQKLEDTEYGLEAQVDFGEILIPKKDGGRLNIWVFAMELCRSRQKYIYATSITIHNSHICLCSSISF